MTKKNNIQFYQRDVNYDFVTVYKATIIHEKLWGGCVEITHSFLKKDFNEEIKSDIEEKITEIYKIINSIDDKCIDVIFRNLSVDPAQADDK